MSTYGDPMFRWKMAGIIATAAIVLSVPLHAIKENRARAARSRLAGPMATFVGRDSCVDCHEAATDAWRGSDHDKAMALASDSSVVGDFDDSEFTYGDIYARFYTRDGSHFVYTQGPDGELAEFEITHTFGHEPLQQYLIPFPGGRLQSLSIAWDTERGEWFHLYPDQEIPPDDWLHWTRGGQNWNGMCAECHSTNLVKGYDAETKTFSTTWSEIDVSCEACHGPGSLHLEWAEITPMARPQLPDYGLVINTTEMTAADQVGLCAPCHSRRTELGDYDHTHTDLMQYLVPSLLREGLYHADGQILEEVYVFASFQQSKMFRNGVRCSDCHDSHSLELKAEGNELCTRCHRADTYDVFEHHFHKREHEGAPSDGHLCVKCHMPEQPYMVIDYRADHSIRNPRPDLTLEIGIPNACSTSGCHDDQTVEWSAEAYTEWYGTKKKPHFGTVIASAREGDPDAGPELIRMASDTLYPAIVRATALELVASYPGEESTAALRIALDDLDPLVRYTAVDAVAAASPEELVDLVSPLLFDPVKAVRLEAAARLAGTPLGMLEPYQREALESAIAEFTEAMEYSLDFSFAGHNLGNLYSALQEPERAETYYRTAIDIDDLFYPAKMNLALLLNSMNRNAEADTLLREILRDYPEIHEAAYSLGLLLAEMQQYSEAAGYLRQASEGMPERSRIHYNLGLLEQMLGRNAEAEAAMLRALEVEPTNIDFLYALADHYLKRGDLELALGIAEQMIATHPENDIGAQMKSFIEADLAPATSPEGQR